MVMVTHPKDFTFKFIKNSFYNLPTPMNLNNFFNYGFMVSMSLILQMLTGIFLASTYNAYRSFEIISEIMRDYNYGWLIRLLHANGATLMFLMMYIHMGRGVYYSSFLKKKAWFTGVILFLLSIIIAFLGYVLVWGQMSYWAATVITNLLSVIPYIGQTLVEWLWGGFSLSKGTLSRFFCFHVILPFVLSMLVVTHLIFVHEFLTTGPSGINTHDDMMKFYPFFIMKDFVMLIIISFFFFLGLMLSPYLLLDSENFIKSNPMMTPEHILPEWYFLPFYAILRSIPSKSLGVMCLMASILILLILPFSNMKKSRMFSLLFKLLFWNLVVNFLILGWIGSMLVESPYILIGQVMTVMYFIVIFISNFSLLSFN
uniref:Cytochrome b n=1 Tax=Bryozoa sp. TaxID=2813608 RepID=A0AAU8L1H3_9BILA